MFTLYDKEAYKLLKKCSHKRDMTEWNEYREKTKNTKINLKFADLSNFYLQNANLKNVDLRFADIDGAIFYDADVENAQIGNEFHRTIRFLLNMYSMLDFLTYSDRNSSIKDAKNPELAIGFDPKYKQTDISVEIEKLEQKAKEIAEDKRNELLREIESLKQQKTIEKAIESLKKPYKYLEHEIKKLRIHNYFFYTLIIASLVAAIYYGIGEYQNRDSYMGVLFGDVKSVDFGSILGISLFYGTPIVFLMFVAVYAVSQINKNIDKIHELLTQKHYIEILESAFNSKTQAGATDEEIQKDLKTAADAIRDATIAKMLGKEPKTEETQKEERYRDRLDYKAIMPLLTALLKSKG